MKTIPEGWSPIPLSKAGSGIAARLSLLREASMNANFLYGGKVMEGGWSANKWNKVGEQFTVEFTATGNGTDSIAVGSFRVPESLIGKLKVLVVCSRSGTAGAGKLVFTSEGGDTEDAALSNIPVEVNVERGGEYTITLGSGTTAGTETLLSLCVYYDHSVSYLGTNSTTFQALSQGYAASVNLKPLSSYLIQKVILDEANIWQESSSTLLSRYYGLPWNKTLGAVDVADYRFRVEKYVKYASIYIYARCVEDTGTFTVSWDGTPIAAATSVALTGSWALYGPYTATVNDDAVNQLTVSCIKTTGDGISGSGIQVAGVYCWEDARLSTELGLPGAETVPAAYRGNDTQSMAGSVAIVADKEDTTDRGWDSLVEDVIYLKSTRRRMLVNDWRVRTFAQLKDVETVWACGVLGFQTSYDGTVEFGTDGLASTGSLAALHLVPGGADLTSIEVWLKVALVHAYRQSNNSNSPPWTWTNDVSTRCEWEIRVSGETTTETRSLYRNNSHYPETTPDADLSGSSVEWIGPFTVDRHASNPYTQIQVEAKIVSEVQQGSTYNYNCRTLILYAVQIRERPLVEDF